MFTLRKYRIKTWVLKVSFLLALRETALSVVILSDDLYYKLIVFFISSNSRSKKPELCGFQFPCLCHVIQMIAIYARFLIKGFAKYDKDR